MTMRLSNLLIAIASISSAVGQVSAKSLRQQGKIVHQDRREVQKTSFDFYVLSMSFQPEFCYMNRRGGFPGCENPLEFWRGSLTLHGMWPEDDDGSWPSTCTNEKFDPSTVYDLGEDRFNELWPNVKSTKDAKSHDSFWEHEWTKHGTCTGMTQDEYFDTALKHFLPTPKIVRDNYGKSVSRDELLEAYRTDQSDIFGDVVLVCSGGKYLSEVRVCVDKSADGSGSDRIKCIPQVEEEDTCGSEITIQKFYIDDDEMVQVAR